MNRTHPVRTTLLVLATAAVAATATAFYQASAQDAPAVRPAVIGTWNATFNHDGQLNPVLVVFHDDGTLMMSGTDADGASLTLGAWRAAQNGDVTFEARVLGAEKGRYVGQIRMHGVVRLNDGRLVGTLGGQGVTPTGKTLFSWEGETLKADRVVAR
ncbi:hypothetical protein [Deinococcus pimensis]|uniref:hypothetical protein n=1 Tax=Deinococcus pimensis TaxID=309888 RepID=UPI0004800CD5|nr:hypothetical protein [Deinococcus pimensis]